MADISKEFLDELEEIFDERYSSNKKIQSLVKKLKQGSSTCEDAFEHAKEVGNLRKLVIHDAITQGLLGNDGRLHYYDALELFSNQLFNNYELINQYCMNTFTSVNKNAGIGIKGISIDYDQDKTDGIIECAVKDVYEKVQNETEEAIVTNAKGYYDSSIRKNASFQYKSGLRPKIIRTAIGKTCKWCQSLAGTYDYNEVSNTGNDVFKRHSNCDCLVVYSPRKGKYQDVWNKQWKSTEEYVNSVNKRIDYSSIKKERITPLLKEKIITGARITDRYSKEAQEFADMYYEEIRHMSTDVQKISQNTGYSFESISKIKNYLFVNNSYFDPDEGVWTRFDPDCAIAQSWQRLWMGDNIKKHDLTLIKHEIYEMKLKEENPNISHDVAHTKASLLYNYSDEYYGLLRKHKKRK